MSFTSKIVLSALLVGITVPAFAQGGTVSVQKPVATTHAPLTHKAASTVEVVKPGSAKPGATVSTGATAGVGTTATPGAAAPTVSTKPAVPAVQTSTTVAPKTN